MTDTATDQHVCANCGRLWDAHTRCMECGGPIFQPPDPGRYRDYCTNRCRQRAYRARGKERTFREQWAREEADKERERQRSYRRRHGAPPPPPPGMPGWCHERPGDRYAAARRRARLLWERASHASANEHERQACFERAEEIRQRYGF